jgi:hypothetical protein
MLADLIWLYAVDAEVVEKNEPGFAEMCPGFFMWIVKGCYESY